MSLDQTLMEIEPILRSTDGTFQFSHPSFQEILTAKQFADEINSGELSVRDAYEISWGSRLIGRTLKFTIGLLHPCKTSEIGNLIVNDKMLLEKSLKRIEFNSVDKNGLIVLVRSTVGSYNAELSVSRIVRYLHNHYGFMLFTLEGSCGKLDASYLLHTYPDEEIKEQVAGYYVNTGKMGGVGLAHMMENGGFYFYGVEDKEKHDKSSKIYLEYFNNKKVIERYLSLISYSPTTMENNVKDVFARIVQLQAVPQDLELYKGNSDKFELDYLKQCYGDPTRKLYSFFEKGLEFYRLTNERSIVMIDNLIEVMHLKNQSAAVLVSTGYHTERQIKAITEKGYSLIVISPRIGKLEEDRLKKYGETMRGDKSEFDKIIEKIARRMVEG